MRGAVFVVVLSIAACQSVDVDELQARNEALERELTETRRAVASVHQREEAMQREMAELRRLSDVLGQEKNVRVAEATMLRGEVRSFIQAQIDALRQFLLQSDLLDYIGAELVERPALDDGPITLVDLANPVPRAGTLTGLGGHFRRLGTVSVLVLRPVGDSCLVVWESQPLKVEQTGLQRLDFPVAVGVEAGDLLAYRFAEQGLVPYDIGTGETGYRRSASLTLGESFTPGRLRGESERRAYSIGVFGLLNTTPG